jgi:hypothetical protein
LIGPSIEHFTVKLARMMPSISALKTSSASKAVDMEKAKATVDYPIEKLDASEDGSQLKEVGERSDSAWEKQDHGEDGNSQLKEVGERSDSAWEKQDNGEDDNKFKEASERRFKEASERSDSASEKQEHDEDDRDSSKGSNVDPNRYPDDPQLGSWGKKLVAAVCVLSKLTFMSN